jgi:hypothetical protein
LTPAQIDAALTYTADPTKRSDSRAMIDIMGGQNPATREQMTKALADDVVLKEFERVLSANGYSSRNVADDMAALQLTERGVQQEVLKRERRHGLRPSQRIHGVM